MVQQEDLREATLKAAAAEMHKLETCLSHTEKKNRKHMATMAAV
jgi:hypothetical protein